MKRALFLVCFLMSCIFMLGQKPTYYRVSANNVVVRTGPGKNYKAVLDPWDQPCKLQKNIVVGSNGKIRNGYLFVEDPSSLNNWGEGWIPLQYVKKAMKCPICRGTGNTGRVCPECNGEGTPYCCSSTGKELCSKCSGVGSY